MQLDSQYNDYLKLGWIGWLDVDSGAINFYIKHNYEK